MCIFKFKPINNFMSSNSIALLSSPLINLTNMIVHYCGLDLVPWDWQERRHANPCSLGGFILIGTTDIKQMHM